MKKRFLLLASAALLGNYSFAQCEAVESFDENFDSFSEFPESCWNGGPSGGMIPPFNLQDDASGGKEVLFYGFTSVGSSFYLVSPELTTINGLSYLTFDGTPVSALGAGLKVQIGTLESPTDYTSFVAHGDEVVISGLETIDFESIAIPAGETHKYVAVRFIPSASHQSLRLDNFVWHAETPAEEVCDPIATLDESFDSFTEFPENCWTTDTGAPFFYLNGDGDKSVMFYGLSSADEHYLVTPELLAIDGTKRLSFMAKRSGTPGDVSVQVGTLTDNTDYSTFMAHGAAIAINNTTSEIEYNSITIPTVAGHKYIALKIKASADHQAMTIDDVKLEETPTSIATLPAELVAIYPNPVENVLNISLPRYNVTDISVYDLVGKQVKHIAANSSVATINVDNLSSGVYLVHINAKEGKFVSKFVKK